MNTPLPLSPFVDPDHRFVLDEDRFMADLAEMPAFLVNPSPEYLAAIDILPVLRVIAGH
ncbi:MULTISPECIES: hypothetical protein [unclassified Bradyrhizobium]|uniref:hypothetical protein n=1 Tax=unclassified Bradyrhizobium TaxID=2631580 RepID=UPI00247841AD|nr:MULTISPECIES: hypothetical protein [unclassified Bradyrhizobium]WGR74319.1 hypothetical protein MTX24_16475 [Bradyrhizobium sp. ISRA426]WGR79154.1 hypothetical protein MTX21_01590 [Bradyrhizobium sp. ISRA430]WGR90642.1 hypothetical protein MTX25_39735 [Bradyrhizobium sp. ISRA432]